MNTTPPDDELSEVDALYRRISAADPSRPGAQVRASVLAHATQVAARAASASENRPAYSWQRRRHAWRRPTAFGALAAGILAVFMFGPHVGPQAPLLPPAPTAQPGAGAPPVFADITSEGAAITMQPPVTAQAKVRPPSHQESERQLVAPPAPQLVPPVRMAAAPPAAMSSDAASPAEARGSLGSGRSKAQLAADATSAVASGAAPVASNAAPADAREDPGAALWRAAESNDLAALRELRGRHADLDLQDAAGRTPLLIATLHGHSQAVALLLEGGANPNIADSSGETPLDAALAADESEIIAALKRHGAR